MGLFRRTSTSSLRCTKPIIVERIIEKVLVKSVGNPNPSKYTILSHKEKNGHLILMLHYPDCINYEGKKILVFENCKLVDLKRQGLIDPHFSTAKGYYSPIARFEPTARGWTMAENLLEFLS